MTGSFGLPLGDSSGEPKGSVWAGRARVRGPQWAQLPLLTVGMLGLQIVWSVEMAYASPYLLSLGLNKSHMALVFVAGPLSGLIMQPLIGVLADHSTSSLGRRRPYMLAASMVSIGGLLLLGFTREFSAIFGGTKDLTIAIAVYAIFCVDFSINAVQAVDRALLVDILPPSLQAAGNAWAGRMFGLGSVAGFFIGGINLPKVLPWLGRTQLEVISIVSSALLLGLHGVTAGSVEEKVLVMDGAASDSNVFVRIFKDIWDNILTLPRTIRSICMVQFLFTSSAPSLALFTDEHSLLSILSSWIAWFPVLFYSSTWVADIYKAAEIANGRAEDDPTLPDEAVRAGSLALLYSSVLSFGISVVAPFFIRPTRNVVDDRSSESAGKFKISLGGLWSISQAIFACSMMATLLPQTVFTATVIITITGFCWAVTQWAPFSLLGEAILLSTPDYSAVPHLAPEVDEIPLVDRRSRRRSSSLSPRRPSLSPTPRRRSPLPSSRPDSPASIRSSTSSIRGEGSGPASALFSNDAARRSRPQLEKRVSGVGVLNGTDDDFQRANDEAVNEAALEIEEPDISTPDDGVGSKAGIILGIHNLVVVLPQFLVTGLSAILFALLEPHRSVLHGKHPGTVPPGTNITLPLMPREEETDASSDSIGLIFRIGGVSAAVASLLAWRLARELAR